MKSLAFILFFAFALVHGNVYLSEDFPFTSSPQSVFVDCTSGSDSSGDGSAGNPYATMGFATANTDFNDWSIDLVISNGPCNEAAHSPVQGFQYVGNGVSPVEITHGFSYTSPGGESISQYFKNFHLVELFFDVTNAQSGINFAFFNCLVGTAQINGSPNYDELGVSFYNSNVQFSTISASVNLYNTTATLIELASQGQLYINGGTFTETTELAAQARVDIVNANVAGATFTSTQTGVNKPVIFIGAPTGTLPSVSGVTVVTSYSN